MASVQSLGIGSGLLTTDLIDKIIAAERQSTDLRLNTQKTELQAKVSAFGQIQSKVDALRTAAQALGETGIGNSTTSSDSSSVSATATPSAQAGVHTVEVSSLARAHTLASIHFADITSTVGTGTLAFRFGTTTFDDQGNYQSFAENDKHPGGTITIDDTNDTVTGVRDAINRANIGVRANIVNDGAGFRLVLTSSQSGAANGMEITATEGTTAGLAALDFNAAASAPGTNMTQTVAADDAQALVDGIPITRDTNTVSGVIDGVTFNLLGLNVGSPAVVSIAKDESGTADKLQAFVSAFNDVRNTTDELTKFDTDTGQGSLLTGDAAVRGLRTQLLRIMSASIPGVGSGGVRSLVDLGVESDQNNGYQLTFDPSKLSDALARDPDGVSALLATFTSASDSQIQFTRYSNATEPSTYDVDISQIATQGTQIGGSLATGAFDNVTIDDNNDSLTVKVDGRTSGPILLAHGTYADGNALAAEIQKEIDADATLKADGVSATVVYNATENRLEVRSDSYGSSSVVAIVAVDASTTASLGLAVDNGESGRGVDVAGRVHGVDGVGHGQVLTIPSGPIPATAGAFEGGSIAGFDAGPLTLDSSNSTFAIRVDGTTSGTIALTQGPYADGVTLATEIETKINADSALSTAGAGVTVRYDTAAQRFVITSKRTGLASSVALTDVPAGTGTALGLATGHAIAGRNATTVNDPAGGAQIRVLGGATGARGSITLVRGVMNRIDQYLNDALSFTGLFQDKTNTLNDELAKNDKDQQAFDDRMTALETRLKTQFAAADALISQLNTTSSYLTQQLGSMPLSVQNQKSSS